MHHSLDVLFSESDKPSAEEGASGLGARANDRLADVVASDDSWLDGHEITLTS